jgi:hypothetical protein
VRKLAINAVMAGCLPTYFPMILAAIAAMAEERFNLYGIQATTHVVAPLLIAVGASAPALTGSMRVVAHPTGKGRTIYRKMWSHRQREVHDGSR